MSRPSAHRSRFGLAGAAVIALLVLSTGSVAAATGPGTVIRHSQNGKSAGANLGGCASNGDGTTTCSGVGLSVFAGKFTTTLTGVTHLNEVCAGTTSFTFDDATGVGHTVSEAGCVTDLPRGALEFGTNLTSVTLAPTTITIQQTVCVEAVGCVPGASRDVTVAGTWTGIGPISLSTYHSNVDDGTCHTNALGKLYFRHASFLGTVAGVSLDQALASIWDQKSSFNSRCNEA
jgi:hypothetical protein